MGPTQFQQLLLTECSEWLVPTSTKDVKCIMSCNCLNSPQTALYCTHPMGELGFRDDNLLKIKKVDVNVDWSKIMHFCPHSQC